MKKITWNELKHETFNLISLVEDSVEITPTDLENTCSSLNNALNDMESLSEALFFKKEKLGKKARISMDESQQKLQDTLLKQLRRLKLEPLGNARVILEKNQEIVELKTMQKIIRYSIELEENSDKVLKSLLESEAFEDWEFLCILLYYFIKYGDDSKSEIYLKYSGLTEKKLVELFKDSLEKEHLYVCLECFNSLKQLGKSKILFETYFYSFDIIRNPIEITPPSFKIIDISKFNKEADSLIEFCTKIKEAISKYSVNGFYIFKTSEDFNRFAIDKIYSVILNKALEMYLNIKNDYLFLQALDNAYTQVESVGRDIEITAQGISLIPYSSDLFDT